MPIIDADGHIAEPEAMFAELPPEFYPRRPPSMAETCR